MPVMFLAAMPRRTITRIQRLIPQCEGGLKGMRVVSQRQELDEATKGKLLLVLLAFCWG